MGVVVSFGTNGRNQTTPATAATNDDNSTVICEKLIAFSSPSKAKRETGSTNREQCVSKGTQFSSVNLPLKFQPNQ